MNRSSIPIQLALALLATSLLTCNCLVRNEDYLDLPTDLSSDFHKNIATTLQKINFKDSIIQFGSWEGITRSIKTAHEEADNPTEKQVYADLIQLQSGDFSGQALDTFLSICAQVDKDPDNDQLIPLRHLKDYFKRIIDNYLYQSFKLAHKHIELTPVPEVVKELNAVFSAAFGMKGGEGPESLELIERMSKFDLATDKSFNAKEMMKAISTTSANKSTKDNFELLQQFMLERCQLLMKNKDIGKIITALDLLRYAGSPEFAGAAQLTNTPFKLADEYNRLCLAIKRPGTSTLIKDNLNERL